MVHKGWSWEGNLDRRERSTCQSLLFGRVINVTATGNMPYLFRLNGTAMSGADVDLTFWEKNLDFPQSSNGSTITEQSFDPAHGLEAWET